MAIYRFRVFIEDDHEVYRDIEVQGKQSFSDLHRAVVQHFNFIHQMPARYDSADHSWYQGDTVVALDSKLEGDQQKIVNHIFDPHQRFLCETQSRNTVWLALELQKILKDEEGAVYPRCVKSQGEPPYYTQPLPEPIKDDRPEESTPRKAVEMFDDDGPSEDEIEQLEKEAKAPAAVKKMKAPPIDMNELMKRSEKSIDDDDDDDDVEEDDDDEDDDDEDDDNRDGNFDSFDVDDLM